MADLPTVGDLLASARRRLAFLTDTPDLDSQVLLAHILNRPRAWLHTHPGFQPSPTQFDAFEQALQVLEAGRPLPYVIGRWEFFGLEFKVTPAVLIPRPETELLVEQALSWLSTHPNRRLAADAGTGSGCIAISLAVKIPDLRLLASDISIAALRVAQANAAMHQVSDRVYFVQADLVPPVKPPFDLLCANLPYIPASRLPTLDVYHKEPPSALDGGSQGLDVIRRLLAGIPGRLSSGGRVLLEIDASQGEIAATLAASAFPEAEIYVQKDLAGLERLLIIDLPA